MPIEDKPLWSVMLPTYNPGSFFLETLQSILTEDPGPNRMQIEIVDDASSGDEAYRAAEAIAPGRITYYKHSHNQGLANCWNTCIERARGELIHILHQDDYVLPNFYSILEQALVQNPSVGAAFSRHFFVDHENCITGLSPPESSASGVLHNWLELITKWQRIQTPSIVVRRATYAKVGGFDPRLLYAVDWEMWIRIAANYDIWYERRPLACYRQHMRSETARLQQRGLITRDLKKAICIAKAYTRATVGSRPSRLALSECARCEAIAAKDELRHRRRLSSITKLVHSLSMCRTVEAIFIALGIYLKPS